MSVGAIFGIVWAIGALLTWRPLARAMAYGRWEDPDGPGWDDMALGMVFAACLCAVGWPVVAAFFGAHRAFKGDRARAAAVILGESRDQKMRRLKREALEREQRIRDLERELEIGR